jgi:hypothetical protein
MSAASSGRVPREEAAMTEVGPQNVSEFFWGFPPMPVTLD